MLEIVPEEGIFLAMHALLAPGDRVVATWPGYQSLTEVARALGARVTRWAPDWEPPFEASARGGGLHPPPRFDPATLAALLARFPRTKLVVVNFPHNPTGALPSRRDWDAIVAAVRACPGPDGNGPYLFSDEMYRGLELEPGLRLPSAPHSYPRRGIALCGVSKALSLPGLRVGWLVSRADAPPGATAKADAGDGDGDGNGPPPRSLLAAVGALKDYTTICGSAPSEVLALMALRARGAILARNRALCAANLAPVNVSRSIFTHWG